MWDKAPLLFFCELGLRGVKWLRVVCCCWGFFVLFLGAFVCFYNSA